MNLSIATAVKNFGRVAEEACKAELVQSCLKKTHFGTSELEQPDCRPEKKGGEITYVSQGDTW